MRLALALGSNIPPRLAAMTRARDLILADLPIQADFRQAPVYQSQPVDCPPDSPPFLNSALELDLPENLLLSFFHRCQDIEQKLGRLPAKNRTPNAPRPVDIDFLYLEQGTRDLPELTLPHPRMTERRFVLQPLADIAPDRIPGGLDYSIRDLLNRLPTDDTSLTIRSLSW